MTTRSRRKAGAQAGRSRRTRGNGRSRFSLARNVADLGAGAQGAIRSGRQAMSSAYRMASGITHALPSPRDMVPHAPRNLQKLVEDNPLLIGAIGLGVGLLLGALLPLSTGHEAAQPSRPSSAPRRRSLVRRARTSAKRTKPTPAAEQKGKTPAAPTSG